MDTIKSTNLLLRFLLELAALAAVCYWGFRTGTGTGTKVLLGIGAPVLVGVIWGLFVAPKAVVTLSEPARVILGLVVLELSALALAAAGQTPVAILFGILILVNAVLMVLWRQ